MEEPRMTYKSYKKKRQKVVSKWIIDREPESKLPIRLPETDDIRWKIRKVESMAARGLSRRWPRRQRRWDLLRQEFG